MSFILSARTQNYRFNWEQQAGGGNEMNLWRNGNANSIRLVGKKAEEPALQNKLQCSIFALPPGYYPCPSQDNNLKVRFFMVVFLKYQSIKSLEIG